MTVTYTAQVATHKGFQFLKLLFRWRGGVYKLVWKDLLIFVTLYYLLNCAYRFVMNPTSRTVFESIVYYCHSYSTLIPLSFIIGFFVSIVMQRWWDQYRKIPWPDSIAIYVSAHLNGKDEIGRLMRRTVMRYVCLCLTLVLTMMSPRIKRRFPTLDHLIKEGFLLENERHVFDIINKAFPAPPKHWIPIVWAAGIITTARKENRIRDDFSTKTIIDEMNKFRSMCGSLLYYDFISIPLVYTQVVTLAVYTHFLCNTIGQQWTNAPNADEYNKSNHLYFPLFPLLQFFFYMGWVKVAEVLINPYGDDDDDFEVDWIIDRNLEMSYLIVGEMHQKHPELNRDQYWDEVFPNELPYTQEMAAKREEPPEPSTAKLDLSRLGGDQKPVAVVEVETEAHISPAYYNLLEESKSDIYAHKSSVKGGVIQIHNGRSIQNIEQPSNIVDNEEMDQFDLLKEERMKERIKRQRRNLTSSFREVATHELENQVEHIDIATVPNVRSTAQSVTHIQLKAEENRENLEMSSSMSKTHKIPDGKI